MTRATSKASITPKPLPTPLAMSAAPSEPSASPIPVRPSSPVPGWEEYEAEAGGLVARSSDGIEAAIEKTKENIVRLELRSAALQRLRPNPKPRFPAPKLRLKVLDLAHPGAEVFFANSKPTSLLSEAVTAVLTTLYEPTKTNKDIPPSRSVTLILRSMGGVAYTTGSDADDNEKRIHFSLDYIHKVSEQAQQSGAPGREIQGVLVHEMVHCWQWNALGSAPGGLIEGIADFVRLKAGLSPAHWRREAGGNWDTGYQHTGYFLEWLENKQGEGSVRRINQALQDEEYGEDKFWNKLFGKRVTELWEDYSRSVGHDQSGRLGQGYGKRRSLSDVDSSLRDVILEGGTKD